MDQLTEYMETALKITKEAGKVMLEGFRSTKSVEVKSASWDLVTEYDKRVETMITEVLSKAYPSHKFIGEETSAADKRKPELTAAPTWIIDPIDGTTNFVHGFPVTGICVGLAVGKEVVAGIVYNPVLEHMFTAVKGRGAFLNDKPIHISRATDLSSSIVSYEISFARDAAIRDFIMKRGLALVSRARAMRCIGSAAVAMCFVAMGSLDMYHIDGIQCWDVAASSIIVQEAGGVVTNSDGSKFDVMSGTILCAGTDQLLREAVECLKKADAS
ncbi:uncharacterized protein LOC134540741 isoform X2 [Bacillus rossius redtenbacheri]|uniref:uncharacterized protein LOC134540741 isoform X1 n=1 Tax=Bacillus rossius redtenbacheri TaxID=93214 RepID=UPI002FDD9B74